VVHISTVDTVRDLDHLRQLVGDLQLNYLGESVGTLIGQTYVNMFPNRVRAMTLDGLIDPVAYMGGTASALASGLRSVDDEFAHSSPSASRPAPQAARSPVADRSGPGWTRSWPVCAGRRSRRRPRPLPAS
jgi:pimeloyl-ACP methyl ester carboxylesterase